MKYFQLKQVVNSLVLCLCMMFGTAYSQLDHPQVQNDELSEVLPPHGGIIVESGKYIVEMVAEMFLAENQLLFYLYKGELKPVSNEGVTGKVIIAINDSIVSEQELVSRGTEFFVAQYKSSKPFNVKVKFLIKKKVYSALFIYKGIN